MKIIKNILLIVILSITISTYGQTKCEKEDEKPYIEVTGIAENEVIPDEIYIKIVIREKYENKTKLTIEEQEEKLKAAIKSLGIDLKNLLLNDVDADYVKISWFKKDVLTKKNYILKVTDATTVGKVFQELEKLEITDANITKVSHSKIDSLRKDIKIMAIKAAKNKADYLLSAIGEQTGKTLIVKEVENNYVTSYSNTYANSTRSSGGLVFIDGVRMKPEENNVIEFQKIKLQSSIYVKFLIK